MNYWQTGVTEPQSFEITPRTHEASVTLPFTADNGIITADTTAYTADATEYSFDSEYVITYTKDGSYTEQTAVATGELNGGVLVLEAVLEVSADCFYYYQVSINGKEIYRGKSFTYETLPEEPLHYSIYH